VTETVPVQPGLFEETPAGPRLRGGTCRSCGRPHFPAGVACPWCSSADVEPVTLSDRGRLWAWTAVTAPPPGYEGEVPFGFGVVELPEGLRVVTRLTEPDPARLTAGQPMRLVVVPLHTDGAGRAVVSYAFAPERG
jgi:uncharacterized OB-fold protein